MNIKAWIVSSLAVFAPIKALMLVVGFLIFADLLTGIMAARKRGEKITSAAMRRTVSKLAVYHIVILAGFLTEVYMIDNAIAISKIAAGIIGITELLSILENSSVILEQNVFKKLIKILGSDNDKA